MKKPKLNWWGIWLLYLLAWLLVLIIIAALLGWLYPIFLEY